MAAQVNGWHLALNGCMSPCSAPRSQPSQRQRQHSALRCSTQDLGNLLEALGAELVSRTSHDAAAAQHAVVLAEQLEQQRGEATQLSATLKYGSGS